ncbi:transcriptional regulator with XRE-family HTH domain [Bacillus fengqiuensis]|nr:transcriptional regulator with XRE-family HTH domain [Bacillus fengqiuensis]
MDYVKIGRLIRDLRRKREYTMVDLAKKLNISQPKLSRIESGNQEVSLALLSKICEEFNLSLSEFILLVEGNNNLGQLQLDATGVAEEEKLEEKLHRMISSFSFEQKKAMYALMHPLIKE